jgi:hypothetical protein
MGNTKRKKENYKENENTARKGRKQYQERKLQEQDAETQIKEYEKDMNAGTEV